MSSCPSRDSLQGLLDERLEGPELEAIEIHIEICPSCQDLLEGLTRGLGWKSTIPECSGAEPLEIEHAIDEPEPSGGSTSELTADFLPVDSIRTLTHSGHSQRLAERRARQSPHRVALGPRLRDPGPAGRGWHGSRLQSAAGGAQPPGRLEDDSWRKSGEARPPCSGFRSKPRQSPGFGISTSFRSTTSAKSTARPMCLSSCSRGAAWQTGSRARRSPDDPQPSCWRRWFWRSAKRTKRASSTAT